MIYNQTTSFELKIGNTFNSETRNDYLAVAQDVLEIIQQLFQGVPPAGYKPIYFELSEEDQPEIKTYREYYLINVALSSEDRDFCRFAYQIGHEFGHLMLGPRRSNGLIETLATLISYKVLDEMTIKWETRSYLPWRNYAPLFREYREKKIEAKHLRHFDESSLVEAEIRIWIDNKKWEKLSTFMLLHKDEQDSNLTSSRNRDLNWVGTVLLRTLPIPWVKFRGLAWSTDPSPYIDSNTRHDLQILPEKVPQEVIPFLQLLGRA